MKKTILALALVLCLVCFAAITVSAEETGHTAHCECGGNLTGIAKEKHEEAGCAIVEEWTALTQENIASFLTTSSKNASFAYMFAEDTGYYYLAEDIVLDKAIEILPGDDITICLNGHKLGISAARSLFRVGASLNICDCVGTGVVESAYKGEAGLIYMLISYGTADLGAEINLYGGTFRNTDNDGTNKSGVIQAGNSGTNPGTLNLWNATITGGTGYAGGNLYIQQDSVTVNMYGGAITNGTATNDGTNANRNRGGNIHLMSGTFNYYGGTISGGSVEEGGYGADIYLRKGKINAYADMGNIDFGYSAEGNYFINFMNREDIGTFTVSSPDGNKIFAANVLTENFSKFTAKDTEKYELYVGAAGKGNKYALALRRIDVFSACSCGGGIAGAIDHIDTISHTCSLTTTDWTDLNAFLAEQTVEAGAAFTMPAGKYYLSADLTINYRLVFGGSTDNKYYLDLNGYTLTGDKVESNCFLRVDDQLYISDSSYDMTAATSAEQFKGAIAVNATRAYPMFYIGGSTKGIVRLFGGKLIYTGEQHGAAFAATSGTFYVFNGYINGGKSNGSAGGVAVYDSGIMTMYAGTIEGGYAAGASGNGGNVFVDKYGYFTMMGGLIQGGTATNRGGNIYVNAGSETKTDAATGIISIKNTYEPTFKMNGGTVKDGTATRGGNVFGNATSRTITNVIDEQEVKTGYTFNANIIITGGTIIGGHATDTAGNIYSYGEMTMSGGLITEGTAENEAGNVAIYYNRTTDFTTGEVILSSKFTMTGGKITKGQAEGNCGNLLSYGITNLVAGEISDGVAGNSGGNIRPFRPGVMTIEKDFVIANGTAANTGGNICMGGIANDESVSFYGTLILNGCTITGGQAQAGQSVAAGPYSKLTVTGETAFTDIHATNADKESAPIIDLSGMTAATPITINGYVDGVVAVAAEDVSAYIAAPEGKTIAYTAGAEGEKGTITLTTNEVTEIATATQLISIEVPAFSSKYYAINSQMNGMYLYITRQSGISVIYNDEVIPYENGVYCIELTGAPTNKIIIVNTGKEDANMAAEINFLKGSENNPIVIDDAAALTSVTAAAGKETYYAINSMLNGMTLNVVTAEGITVTVNGTTLTADENGLVTVTLTGVPMNKVVVKNEGEEAVELVAALEWPLGSEQNPIVINSAAELTTVEAGKFYAVSAMLNGKFLVIEKAAGAVSLNGVALTEENGYFVAELTGAPMNKLTATATAVAQIVDEKPEFEPEIVKFDIAVARMILGNSLEFQFGVAKANFTDMTGVYAVVEKSWADGTTTEQIIPATEWIDANPYWAISYDTLAAKEMADVFNVTIYNAKGQAISNPKTDSVRDYVMRNVDKQNVKGKTIMVDMLNYGAAAQQRFGYGTSDLANNQLTETQQGWASQELAALTNGQVKGTNFLGTRLILESRIQLQMAFKNLKTDMYAIYTFTNNKGQVQNIRVEGTEFVDANGVLAIEMSELVYADARALVEVTVYNADGTVYGTATDSIEGYAARNNSTGDDVVALLMKFADSAKVYLYG